MPVLSHVGHKTFFFDSHLKEGAALFYMTSTIYVHLLSLSPFCRGKRRRRERKEAFAFFNFLVFSPFSSSSPSSSSPPSLVFARPKTKGLIGCCTSLLSLLLLLLLPPPFLSLSATLPGRAELFLSCWHGSFLELPELVIPGNRSNDKACINI